MNIRQALDNGTFFLKKNQIKLPQLESEILMSYTLKKKRSEIKKVEKIIHPLVRKQIKIFIKKNKKNRFIFFEIPLLFESNLARNYDVIIFVNSSRKKRLKRYLKRGNNKEMFNLLDKRQLSSKKKIKFSDYVINNNGSLNKLKIKIKSIKNKL